MKSHDKFSKISDAIGVPLKYLNGEINGYRIGRMQLPNGGSLGVNIMAVNFFVNEQAGVLFRVAGCLYALVGYNPKTDTVSMFLVNGEGITPAGIIKTSMTLKDAVISLKTHIVASFVWGHNRWTPFTPDILK